MTGPSPYLAACLRVYLGERHWPFERLARSLDWNRKPEFLANARALAHELGLMPPPKPDPLDRLMQLRCQPSVEPPAIPSLVKPPSIKGFAPWEFDEGDPNDKH